jgi:hypothetical protein
MVTFNVDSLDFVDDETTRFGADPDFDLGFDSANTRLELDDLTNGVTGYVQQNRAGDLVDGRFAETVAEGKALSDDGNLYEDPQNAIDNANSWVKLGPGVFDGINFNTNGLTLLGSGEQTILRGGGTLVLWLNASDGYIADLSIEPYKSTNGIGTSGSSGSVTLENIKITGGEDGVRFDDVGGYVLSNCTIKDTNGQGVVSNSGTNIIVNNVFKNTGNNSITNGSGTEDIIASNEITGADGNGIRLSGNDSIAIANRVHNSSSDGISEGGSDNIVANNRISNSGGQDIDSGGTNPVLDANLTGSAN